MRSHAKAPSAESNQRQASGRSGFAWLSVVGLLFALSLAACLAPASAFAGAAHEYEKSFGPDGTSATHFALPGPIGVDQQSHDVYVADLEAGTVEKFDQNGAPVNFSALGSNEIGGFSFFFGEGLESLNQIAVNSDETSPSFHDFYVVNAGAESIKAFKQNGEPAEFTAGPGVGANEIPGLGLVTGVAVDANGDIYASNFGKVKIFESSGAEITSFSAAEGCNLAVDSHGAVYVAPYYANGLALKKFTPSQFPVTPATTYDSGVAIDPHPVFGLAIDPASDDLYVDEHTQIVQYNEAGEFAGEFAQSGEPGALTASEGVAVDGATEDVYASDVGGEKQVEIFAPPPPEPPEVLSLSFSGVTAISANLQAQINPNLFATHYHFEYLTEAQYLANGETFAGALSTPEADLGSAGTAQTARAHIGGLATDTTYRFRVAAENQNNKGSPLFSPEAGKLTTFAAFAPGLPDGRAYEMVSPPQKAGEVLPPEPFSRLGSSCFGCLPGINDGLMPMQSTADGKAVVYVGFPFSAGLAAGPNEYLARRSASGWGSQSLSSPLFSRRDEQGYKAFSDDLSRGVLYQIEPTLSPEAPTSEGKSFGNLYLRDKSGSLQPLVTEAPEHRDPGKPGNNNVFKIGYAAANAGVGAARAFSHLAFEANDALTEEIPGIAPDAPLVAANEKNLYEWVDGQLRLLNVLPGNAEAASGAVIGSGQELAGGGEGADFDQAVSADGRRIFWSKKASGQVYVRIDGKETKEIQDPGKFLIAAPDGSKLLLSDGCLYDLKAEACEEDLAQGQGEKFKGILGNSEDLSRVYFVDTAGLTPPGEENANGEHAEAGKLNLYAWSEGATIFIGALVAGDNEVTSAPPRMGDWKPSASSRTAQASPDGRYLAFMSAASLTGYDNNVAGGGQCRHAPASTCFEVFEYDAGSQSLICASCNPSGESPLGGANLTLVQRGDNNALALSGFPQPGNLSAQGSGRLFFESQDDLSPRDTNGQIQDVYEWEPNGVGSCKRVGGCIRLISSGSGLNDSMFVDGTPSGDDAFFITREQLTLADRDEQLDLYDARVGGGIAAEGETIRSECQGEACQPAAILPNDPTPSSSAFHGAGDEKPKPKHKKKHKRHAKKRHHKRAANTNRGGAK